MKFNKIYILIVVLLSSFIVYASSSTKNDPLVSLSYLDNRIEALKVQLKSELREEFEKEKSENTQNSNTTSFPVFQVMELKENKQIMFSDSAEFILRSGEAVVFDMTSNGIADLTSGTTIRNDEEIIKNHHMLVPRNDGRGVRSITPIWIMIKGEYLVKDFQN